MCVFSVFVQPIQSIFAEKTIPLLPLFFLWSPCMPEWQGPWVRTLFVLPHFPFLESVFFQTLCFQMFQLQQFLWGLYHTGSLMVHHPFSCCLFDQVQRGSRENSNDSLSIEQLLFPLSPNSRARKERCCFPSWLLKAMVFKRPFDLTFTDCQGNQFLACIQRHSPSLACSGH